MKNYTLSEKFFWEFSEISETIGYINDKFPGLLENDFHSYLSRGYIDGSTKECKEKLAITVSFIEAFGSKLKSHELNSCRDKESRSDILLRDFLVTKDELKIVDIEYAIDNELLVEVNSFILTSNEKDLLILSLNYYHNNPLANPNIIARVGELIDKLKDV